MANKLKSDIIDHKNYIGGRYSVLSEVGMVPAELMGLNEKKFKRLNYLIKNKKFINFLIENVSSIYSNIIKGKKNCVILNYDEKSSDLFYWYQQLVAESLGKKSQGFFPIVSNVPKDHHSLLQLYLDGPKDKLFIIFSNNEKPTKKLSVNKFLNKNTLSIEVSNKINNVISKDIKSLIKYDDVKIQKTNMSTHAILISDNKKVPNLNTVLKQINKLKLDVIEANFQKVSLEEIFRKITSENNSK